MIKILKPSHMLLLKHRYSKSEWANDRIRATTEDDLLRAMPKATVNIPSSIICSHAHTHTHTTTITTLRQIVFKDMGEGIWRFLEK